MERKAGEMVVINSADNDKGWVVTETLLKMSENQNENTVQSNTSDNEGDAQNESGDAKKEKEESTNKHTQMHRTTRMHFIII